MKSWKQFLLINACAFVGAFLAIFTLSADMPFWLWLMCSLAVISVLNLIVYKPLRREMSRTEAHPPISSSHL